MKPKAEATKTATPSVRKRDQKRLKAPQKRTLGLDSAALSLGIAAIIIAGGTARDALLLFRFPVAAGLDGYYYVQQLATLQQTGHLYYPTHTPIAFWLCERSVDLFRHQSLP